MNLVWYAHFQSGLSSGPYLKLVVRPETVIHTGFGSNDAVPVVIVSKSGFSYESFHSI